MVTPFISSKFHASDLLIKWYLVYMELTEQEILKSQGTRLNSKAPWETYSSSFEEKLDPKLEEEIKRYSEKVHSKSSSQNEEELARQKELSASMSKEYQWVNPAEYKDEGARKGKILHSSEFINILRNKLGLKCRYRVHPQPRKVTLLVQRNNAEMLPPEVACWAQIGFMPEYEIVRFDEHGVPLDSKYRGWRTCLLQMILKGIITEEQVNNVFGRATGPASERYNSTLYGVRNHYVAVK
jgi:predicted house-cleaning noncanonical NTP pyrophosphatase (MazG superfamily)